MPHKDFNIVLRVDATNEKVLDTFLEVVKEKARELDVVAKFTHGSLNDGSPKPQVKVYTDDYFSGADDVDWEQQDNKSPS